MWDVVICWTCDHMAVVGLGLFVLGALLGFAAGHGYMRLTQEMDDAEDTKEWLRHGH